MRKKRLRIVNKLRFTTFLVCVFLFIFAVINTALNTVESAEILKYKHICVQSGDTLWALANEYGDESLDKRKIIHEISNLNDLNHHYIYPGQVLKIPQK